IEDNCDALGSEIDGKRTGTLGHLATHSFYPAHHMTTGEGGMVVTNDGKLKRAAESIRDWGRDCWCPPGKDNTCGKRFDWKFPHLPAGYDHKYVYSHIGLNLKSTDIQAALGLAQMDRLDGFIQTRKENFWCMKSGMTFLGLDKYFILPKVTPNSSPSWFGFPLTIKRKESDLTEPVFEREALMRFLNERKIGTRLLFASNYIAQPAFQNILDADWETNFAYLSHFTSTNMIKRDTFWIACHPALTPDMMIYMLESLEEFVNAQ
ncbi:MAG: DegT/DnrJ/EryC1/StrS family aminotransferase, partial [Thermoplasmata archaeon]|nr:DegT/DnrJ/EryC1/StrS family aminotransferase [Thermoplasmata archaeon]